MYLHGVILFIERIYKVKDPNKFITHIASLLYYMKGWRRQIVMSNIAKSYDDSSVFFYIVCGVKRGFSRTSSIISYHVDKKDVHWIQRYICESMLSTCHSSEMARTPNGEVCPTNAPACKLHMCDWNTWLVAQYSHLVSTIHSNMAHSQRDVARFPFSSKFHSFKWMHLLFTRGFIYYQWKVDSTLLLVCLITRQ